MDTHELESMDIEGLARHTPDELLDNVLTVAERRYTYDDFYQRWESQHWLATGIDFSVDAEQWPKLPQALRNEMLGTMAAFYQGEQSVTQNLAPLMMAAPRIDHEIFLTTQTVDEARHVVFFRRFFNDVIKLEGGTQEHLERFRPYYGRWYTNLFFGPRGLDGRGDALRKNPSDIGLFVETVTLYHLVLEAGLALLGQRFLLDLCRNLGVLPGFYKGFMAVTRDESRHVGFGVRVLRELREADPSLGPRIMDVMRESIPDVVRLTHPPDQDHNLELLEVIPAEFVIGPQEAHRYAFTHILKRLSAVGFGTDEVNELGEFAWAEFEKALGEWEARTGGTHYARLYEKDHALGPARVA
ncbi:MAG TPA: ribonucleotide-diphosphate reductase subunit beta [Actinomycetota bacterium]|nr:ribonucleotide-diphosphate reductase subunit beta [Actinomycetota bacterium]